MQVILLETVNNLGVLGDSVSVKSGFGRNYLIPFGKAVPATKSNIADFEARRSELEAAAADRLRAAETRAHQLKDMAVTIERKAGDEGKLFGSVGTRDIASAVTEAGVAIEKSEVLMPEGVLRETGSYEFDIQLHPEVTETIVVNVVALV